MLLSKMPWRFAGIEPSTKGYAGVPVSHRLLGVRKPIACKNESVRLPSSPNAPRS